MAWSEAAESVARGYDTEFSLYREENPPPRLRDWLRHRQDREER